MKNKKHIVMVGIVWFCLLGLFSSQAFADWGDRLGILVEQRKWERTEVPSNQDTDRDGIVFEKPVTVQYEERTYSVSSSAGATSANTFSNQLPMLGGSLNITMPHSQSSTRWSGSQCYLFTVQAGAKTQTNQCVDYIYVKASTVGGGAESAGDERTDWLGCKDDTGWEYENSTWAQGTTVSTRGDHKVTWSGINYHYLNQDYPSSTLPYEPQCAG